MTTVHIPDVTMPRSFGKPRRRTVAPWDERWRARAPAAYLASRAKLDALRAAIDEGDASGIAEDSSLEGILADVGAGRGRPPSQP